MSSTASACAAVFYGAAFPAVQNLVLAAHDDGRFHPKLRGQPVAGRRDFAGMADARPAPQQESHVLLEDILAQIESLGERVAWMIRRDELLDRWRRLGSLHARCLADRQ